MSDRAFKLFTTRRPYRCSRCGRRTWSVPEHYTSLADAVRGASSDGQALDSLNWMPAPAPIAPQPNQLATSPLLPPEDERRSTSRVDRRRVPSPGRRRTDPDPAVFAALN